MVVLFFDASLTEVGFGYYHHHYLQVQQLVVSLFPVQVLVLDHPILKQISIPYQPLRPSFLQPTQKLAEAG